MKFRAFQQIILPEVMATGAQVGEIVALINELRAKFAKAKGVPVENVLVEIVLTDSSEHSAAPHMRCSSPCA